jgi:hypothetical protein
MTRGETACAACSVRVISGAGVSWKPLEMWWSEKEGSRPGRHGPVASLLAPNVVILPVERSGESTVVEGARLLVAMTLLVVSMIVRCRGPQRQKRRLNLLWRPRRVFGMCC